MNSSTDYLDRSSEGASRARWTIRVTCVGVACLLGWAAVSKIDQVTRAPAQMIATARTQLVQAPDGGVLEQLNVREGDVVQAGQQLAVFERARAQASVDDSRAKVAAMRITLARLQAEVMGTAFRIEPALQGYSEYVRNQRGLYEKRRAAINEDVSALTKSLSIANEELRLNESLEATGDVSRVDVLRLQRQAAEIEFQMTTRRNKYLQDAQAEMTKVQEELNSQTEQLRDRSQLLEHTLLVAPATGIVKNVRVTTIGGVLRAGDTVLEILPTDGELIAEAKVSPSDIAFIEVGQPATVKLDAYDSAIFGALKGEVSYVSADTLTEEGRNGTQAYYRVHIRIDNAAQTTARGSERIRVRPGMTASVDVKAMERTVLSYLTKPITKTLSQSMGER